MIRPARRVSAAAGLLLLACTAPRAAAEERPRYYPTLVGPRLVDPTVPQGQGPRFTLCSGRHVGGQAEQIRLIRTQPEKYRIIAEDLGREDKVRLLLEDPRRRTVAIAEGEDTVVYYYLHDEWAKQAREKWAAGATEKYLVRDGIGDFRVAYEYFSYEDYLGNHMDDGRVYELTSRLRGPDKRDFDVVIQWCEQPNRRIVHDRIRFQLTQNPRLVRHGEGHILECRTSRGDTRAYWPAGDRLAVTVMATGQYPGPVIEAYLRKYPSTLPADFQLDRNEWAREHVDIILGIMRASVAASDVDMANAFVWGPAMLKEWVVVDFGEEPGQDSTLQERRAFLARVEAWARASRGKLSWVPEKGRFVVTDGPVEPSPLVSGRTTAGRFVRIVIALAIVAAGVAAAFVVLRLRRLRAARADGRAAPLLV